MQFIEPYESCIRNIWNIRKLDDSTRKAVIAWLRRTNIK